MTENNVIMFKIEIYCIHIDGMTKNKLIIFQLLLI